MRKLALSDEILLRIENPARYIGGEINAVMKDPSEIAIRFCMIFPDVYEIGMSHLGLQILYHMFNERKDTWCERAFSPWTDLDQIMRKEQIPLFALESQDPLKEMDFLGITIQYEMCYTNILQILDLAKIPLHASERGELDPLVIGGGPCAFNPEPLAPFFDLFYIGEGETIYHDLLDAYRQNKEAGGSRVDFLRKAAQLPGIYVPAFYAVSYHEDGTLASFIPTDPCAPCVITKQAAMDLSAISYPDNPIVPFTKVTQDRVTLEIQRGCIRGCRFCQAGMIYRPNRERDLDQLKEIAGKMLRSTGQDEISLSSLSSSDYTNLGDLVQYLIDEFSGEGVNISLPSLRIDAFSLDVMQKIQDIHKSSLTFAPEAGTQRMRDVINKGLTEDEILRGAHDAFAGGWHKVKLYFILGLPTETETDMRGIAELAEKIAEEYYETVPKQQRQGKVQITVSTSFFVPKPFTPFQWAPMCTREAYLDKAAFVKNSIRTQQNQKSIHYQWHEADVTLLEGFLARGDREASRVIETAYQKGALYDAWSESFRWDIWMNAFQEAGVDLDFYTQRERDPDERLPWDFIDAGVTKTFLKREWSRALKGKVTPNCRQECSGCGARKLQGGVCYEGKD